MRRWATESNRFSRGEDKAVEWNGFWSRVAAWIRGNGDDFAATTPSMAGGRASDNPLPKAPPGRSNDMTPQPALPPTDVPRARVSETMFSDGATRGLQDSVDGLRRELASQSERSASLLGALERLAEGLERLPEVAQSELGLLGRIGEDAAEGVEGISKLGRTVEGLPPLVRETREAALSLVDQAAHARRTQEQHAASLDGVRVAMQKLSDAAQATNARLAAMQHHAEMAHNRMTLLLERQADRLLWFCASAIVVGVLALWLAMGR